MSDQIPCLRKIVAEAKNLGEIYLIAMKNCKSCSCSQFYPHSWIEGALLPIRSRPPPPRPNI